MNGCVQIPNECVQSRRKGALETHKWRIRSKPITFKHSCTHSIQETWENRSDPRNSGEKFKYLNKLILQTVKEIANELTLLRNQFLRWHLNDPIVIHSLMSTRTKLYKAIAWKSDAHLTNSERGLTKPRIYLSKMSFLVW